MAPTAPGTPPDFRAPHEAVAYTTAMDDPPKFYGACRAGDFTSTAKRDTQEAARADVAEHLLEVTRQPHRAFVNSVREWPHGFLGFCAAGDYSPGLVRASRAEAEADVASHLMEIGREAPDGVPRDERLPNPDGGLGVILTAVSIDGQQVLAVPREVALAELRTAALLAKASTFGEVRQDADAAAVVEQYMNEYRQRLLDEADWPEEDDEEVLARLTGDDGDYHAPHFFSDDEQLEWQAYAEVRASTANWLGQSEPALLERYGRYDDAEGPMYEKAAWIAAADRGALEQDLLAVGYTVQPVDTLHELYLDPPLDVEDALDRGELL